MYSFASFRFSGGASSARRMVALNIPSVSPPGSGQSVSGSEGYVCLISIAIADVEDHVSLQLSDDVNLRTRTASPMVMHE
jgi:hypothetical protein